MGEYLSECLYYLDFSTYAYITLIWQSTLVVTLAWYICIIGEYLSHGCLAFIFKVGSPIRARWWLSLWSDVLLS